MKDFRLDRKAEPKYILDIDTKVEKVKTEEGTQTEETLSVRFADGRVFRNIHYSEDNIQKVIEQQERQAQAGLENINVFERRKTLAGIMTGATIVGGPVISVMATSMLGTSENPYVMALNAGIVTLLALVPSVCTLIKNSGKVRELHKIKYRNEHKDDLRSYPLYQNALAGLSSSKKQWFELMAQEGLDPFAITEIDLYSKKDLEQIVENIDTEKQYQFVYAPRRSATSKK